MIQGFHQWCKNTEMGNIRRHIKVLMVRYPWGLSSVSNIFGIFSPTGSLHTNNFPLGLWHTTPIPMSDAYVALFQVDSCGLIYLKCVGLIAKEVIKFCHGFILS